MFQRQTLDSLMLFASDGLILLTGLYLGDWIVHQLHGLPLSARYSLALIPVWWAGSMAVRIVPSWGLGAVEEFRRIQLLLITVFAMAGVAVFLRRGTLVSSRIVYLVSYLFSAALIPLARIPVKKFLVTRGCWGCPVAIYGSPEQAELVIESFRSEPLLGYVPHAVFTDSRSPGDQIAGVPVLGGLSGFSPDASAAVVPVRLVEELSASGQFDKTLSGYRRVVVLPELREDVFLWALPRTLGSLIGLEITSNLLNPFARLLKRGIDLVLTLLTAPLWIPLMAFVALLIALIDRQNPFFIQHRIGKGGQIFRPFKFRTMVGNADAILEQALLDSPALKEEWARTCKLRNDPRVTPLGRLLRRTSLDELPQLFNVLAGQMSLVGPRPLPVYHHEQLAESARAPRSRVRPGLTGLWQVSGRSDSGNAGMEKWDTYYVRNWSVWLDIIILARTFSAVIRGKGAY